MSRIVDNNDNGYIWGVTFSVQCEACGSQRHFNTLTLEDAKRQPKAIAWKETHSRTCVYRDHK
jgi:hypothetical protein